MTYVIDASQNIGGHAEELFHAGIRVIIRYYSHSNSSKRLDKAEAKALTGAGLLLAVVFEQNGGDKGKISDFSATNAKRDGKRALDLAKKLGQPHGSAIYFAVDWDYYRSKDLKVIEAYFSAISAALSGKYRVGVYGSGTVGQHMLDTGVAGLVWLAQSTGWSGYKTMLKSGNWNIQQQRSRRFPKLGFEYDADTVNPASNDFGQFSLAQAEIEAFPPPMAMLSVSARNGLNLRRGPGEDYSVVTTLPYGTLVHGQSAHPPWVKVDIEGDGKADGFMHESFLEAVTGGFRLRAPSGASPYEIARAELAHGVKEAPGAANNPRIILYHGSTTLKATEDSVPWCSSFVNYCVEASGQRGTRSASAMSWHDNDWGEDVTDAPQAGDIVVWKRKYKGKDGKWNTGGHVGFFVKDLGDRIAVLGGNQGDAVSITSYPKKSDRYTLLSIRRGAI